MFADNFYMHSFLESCRMERYLRPSEPAADFPGFLRAFVSRLEKHETLWQKIRFEKALGKDSNFPESDRFFDQQAFEIQNAQRSQEFVVAVMPQLAEERNKNHGSCVQKW